MNDFIFVLQTSDNFNPIAIFVMVFVLLFKVINHFGQILYLHIGFWKHMRELIFQSGFVLIDFFLKLLHLLLIISPIVFDDIIESLHFLLEV